MIRSKEYKRTEDLLQLSAYLGNGTGKVCKV